MLEAERPGNREEDRRKEVAGSSGPEYNRWGRRGALESAMACTGSKTGMKRHYRDRTNVYLALAH